MKYNWTDTEFLDIVKNSFSIREVFTKMGVVPAGGNYKTFYSRVERLGASIDHFTGQAHLKGKSHDWNAKIPMEKILVQNSTYSTTSYLKKRLVKEGYLKNNCAGCGIFDWLGKPLSLHLDHIDGDNTNNLIDNLRLLCPNCHSLTPTYCGKNKKK